MADIYTDSVIACADLVGRAGAKDFEIGYLHDHVPVEEAGWYAVATYQGDTPSADWLEKRDYELDGEQPTYRELFDLDGGYVFRCIVCGRSDLPCPEHAPTEFPGLRLVECWMPEKHHGRMWVYEADDYGAPCPRCQWELADQRIDELTRCRHWPWRRWRATRWVLRWLPLSYATVSGGPDHHWCAYQFHWWWGRYRWDGWRCLRSGHWPGELIGLGDLCGKCLPCPDCGSTTAGHEAPCPWYDGPEVRHAG